MKPRIFFKNIQFLFNYCLDSRISDVEEDVDLAISESNRVDGNLNTYQRLNASMITHLQQEQASLHDSIQNVVLPLPSHKVCIPNPAILESADWVTATYFCNTVGISDRLVVAENAYNVWKETHFGKEPTPSRHNAAYPVYPVGFLQDLINGRYDDILNK